MPKAKKEYKRITVKSLLDMKTDGEKISMLTAYDFTTAAMVDRSGIDIILVGDSVGTAMYGMKTTKEVKLETMILHGKTVKSSTKKSLVVFDMPYKTYPNKFVAYKNVKNVMKLTKCDAVKLEGGSEIEESII